MPKFSISQKKCIYEKLLYHGEVLFNEKGLINVTAEEIALASGIAKGTFYHFYKNKEHLYMQINNNLQEDIFNGLRSHLTNPTPSSCSQSTSEQFYQTLCYVLEEFLKHPLIMDISPETWLQLEAKAPIELIDDNNKRDLSLISFMESTGLKFRYDLETTMKLLQLQFTQLAYIKKETDQINLMKIILLALSKELIQEEDL